MTPNAFLKLLHRGKEYLSLADVGVLVFDECHQARKKHPYARVMEFYKDLQENGGPLPKVIERRYTLLTRLRPRALKIKALNGHTPTPR